MSMLHLLRPSLPCRRISLSRRTLSTWVENAANPKYKVQTYLSTSRDPYLNLSIEQFLLERTPADSCILFLYINRPCIVIGRNQNPWLEVNLNLLRAASNGSRQAELPQTEPHNLGKVDLVRRRSGGGAVFHDEGNVNWSIICPSSIFTRDKHAEMIVRALRKNGIERARVNERHDIVLDQGSEAHRDDNDPKDLHRTPFTVDADVDGVVDPRPVKVSGSAYKLTKGRALHHGTCLLSSPNLQVIPHYLHSPARGFIKAKGVESVSSPVANIELDTRIFQDAVRKGFEELYQSAGSIDLDIKIGERALEVGRVKSIWEEMQTLEWTYGQTPQFTFSTKPLEGTTRKIVHTVKDFPGSSHLTFDFKHGQLIEARKSASGTGNAGGNGDVPFKPSADTSKLYEPDWRWNHMLSEIRGHGQVAETQKEVAWLKKMLPNSHKM